MASFSAQEAKIVINTLSKRRAWLRKTLDDSSLDPGVRQEHIESIKLLDSALKKMTGKPAPSAAPHRTVTMANARVLVAEDNADSANLLMDVLQDFGMKQVELADDGIQAFDKIKGAKAAYDLILCDWDMPGLTGLEVHTKAKASNTLRHAHFIMVTAVSEAARIREAIQQGVNDYIVKPIDIDILESKIRAALHIDDSADKSEDDESAA